MSRTAPPGPSSPPLVCVQGLGFVGAAMALAVADSRDARGRPLFDVVGVELDDSNGRRKVECINRGELPLEANDPKLGQAFQRVLKQGNLRASVSAEVYESASVVVVDVHHDVDFESRPPRPRPEAFEAAIKTLGSRIPPDCLVLVETTVPPGTCERVVLPLLEEGFRQRGLPPQAVLLAHSSERVMPGPEYYDSIKRMWRVYAGCTEAAAERAAAFLAQVIDTDSFPMRRLSSTTATELSKVLENTYRAVNIALIDEWAQFAEQIDVDLFEVIDAIRMRPTHSNIRQPGFGVGGYCLTKDPLFASSAAAHLFLRPDIEFPFSTLAVSVNQRMPLVTLDRLDKALGGLDGREILLLGVSYRPGVADTRYSASETFVREAERRGAAVLCHDPLLRHWPELGLELPADLPAPDGCAAVVFAVPHREYRDLDVASWLGESRPLIVDANDVLPVGMRRSLREIGCRVLSTGRGDDCE